MSTVIENPTSQDNPEDKVPPTGESGTAAGRSRKRFSDDPLRIGVASIWLSVIVLLPLAAIVWQSAEGGWGAFVSAVTSNSVSGSHSPGPSVNSVPWC
ncbi:sulfate ABC transporter, permease protein CysT [Mycobacteroides abscessus subsp. abscessus]|nr:sulfate ABC transporter, permease protein CysT [Mycobacteroides abscessus subsp. abscessus]